MKKIKGKILLIFICFNIIFFGLYPLKVKALDNLDFTFDDNVLFERENITAFNDPYNLRESGVYTDIYNASYSFTNDILGTFPIGWLDGSSGSATIEVISNFVSHSNVVKLFDPDGSSQTTMRYVFESNQTSESFEFWYARNDTSAHTNYIRLTENDINRIYFVFSANDILYYDGSFHTLASNVINVNTWYHILVDWNDGANIYTLYLNKIPVGVDIPYFGASLVGLQDIYLTSDTGSILTSYFDGIGFPWIINYIPNFIYTFSEFPNGKVFDEDTINDIYISFEYPIISSDTSASIDDTNGIDGQYLKLIDGEGVVFITINILHRRSVINITSFYFRLNDTSQPFDEIVRFRQSGTPLFFPLINSGQLYYDDIPYATILDNTWYFLEISYNCITDTISISLDGNLLASSLPFLTNGDYIDEIQLKTSLTNSNYAKDFDTILAGAELINHTQFQALLPYLNVSETLQEVDRYEFALKDINLFNFPGTSNPNGWTDIELPSGDKVSVTTELDGSYDFLIESETGVGVMNESRGIERTFDLSATFLNISMEIIPIIFDGTVNRIFFEIESSDSQDITAIRIDATLDILYLDNTGYHEIVTEMTLGNRYAFNLFINYELNRVFLIVKENNTIVEYIDYPTMEIDAEGLHHIAIYSFNFDDNNVKYFIDYVGIYINGISQVIKGQDFGIALIDELDVSGIWNFHNQNLVNITANGTFHFGGIEDFYFRGGTIRLVKDTSDYNYIPQLINIYDKFFEPGLSNPTAIFTVLGRFFDVSYLKIDGVLLNESSNSYNLILEHDNVDIDESFFSVIGNRLVFSHISNDTDLEYIQASFNISDISSSGYSVSFVSNINQNAFGLFRVKFTDTSNIIQFPFIESTTRFILSQNLTVREFIILITDRDDNSVDGLTSGFVSNIKLISTADITVSLLITTLIAMMIPLLIIIIPSVLISQRFGKILIIPLFLLMSIICVATAIIPLWLFFIIGFSCTVFIAKRNRGKIE